MISRHAVVLQHLKSGRVIADLPVVSASATEIINAPGALDVEIPLSTTDTILRPDDVRERATGVFLLRDDVVVGEGIIETTSMDVASNSAKLSCLGWHHYLRNLYLRQDASWSAADQSTIVKWLVDYASSKPGAIKIGTDTIAPTGRIRQRNYLGWERQSIGKLVEDLAGVIDGFNFRYRSRRGDTGFEPEMLIGYPAIGRRTNYVLELGSNVELLNQDGDGVSVANSAEMIGAGQGPEAPIVTLTNTDSLNTTPLWESVETHADVIKQSTLIEKAQRRLTLGAQAIRIPTLRLGADTDPKLGTYNVGDRVRVRGKFGLLDVDSDFLITQTKYEPASATVDVSVASVEVLR